MPKSDERYSSLPKPKSYPTDAPSPPTKGWWIDPFPRKGGFAQRYHDGLRWTQYTSLRTMRNWSEIVEIAPPEST